MTHTMLPGAASQIAHLTHDAVLDVVIPVYNEERDLEPCVRRLHAHLREGFPYPFRITIADNASTDTTPAVATALSRELAEVRAVHLDQKGRGRAVNAVWSSSDAPVLAYIHEVPVDWVDDPDSRVDILATAIADLKGIWRLGRGLATGALPPGDLRRQLSRDPMPPQDGVPKGLARHLVRFAAVGVASTLAYIMIFALLRLVTGAQAANLLALAAHSPRYGALVTAGCKAPSWAPLTGVRTGNAPGRQAPPGRTSCRVARSAAADKPGFGDLREHRVSCAAWIVGGDTFGDAAVPRLDATHSSRCGRPYVPGSVALWLFASRSAA